MLLEALSPAPSLLRFENVAITEEGLTISSVAVAAKAECPRCDRPSDRVHSRYRRTPQDLPCMGWKVQLSVTARRFWCDWPECPQRIFVERLGEAVRSYARKTTRLKEALSRIALSVGGEAGARLLAALGMEASSSTLLRFVMAHPLPDPGTPEILGVDDWAKCRGQSYGTVLVDLRTHRIIELLPDRKAETFATWLKEHPGVKVISRDRAGAYAKGGSEGAPEAVQVADRWHLLHNLGEALERVFRERHDDMRAAAEEVIQGPSPTAPIDERLSVAKKPTRDEVLSDQRHQARQARYDRVKQLAAEGVAVTAIARELGMVPRTVKKYLRNAEPRPWGGRRTPPTVEPWDGFLRQRWNEGCHNARQLLDELKKQGFDGTLAAVKRYVKPWRALPQEAVPAKGLEDLRNMTAGQAVWLFLRTKRPLSAEQQLFKAALCKLSPDLDRIGRHVRSFQDILVGRSSSTLCWWMDGCETLGPEMASFVSGVKRDQQAVENAIALPWSQGPTEGLINRLKALKRQMYGRASLDLLRRRLILAP